MAEETILGKIGAKTFEKIPKDIKRPISKETKSGQEQLTKNVAAAYTAPDVFIDKVDNQFRNDSIIKFSIISLIGTLISLLLYFRYKRLGKS